MRVIRDPAHEPDDCLTQYLEFEEYGDNSEEEVFFYGYGSCRNMDLREKYKNYKRRIFLQMEQPCGFVGPKEENDFHTNIFDYYTEIHSTCPYTAEWLNKVKGGTKYRTTPFPYNTRYKSDNMDKPFDVINWGGIYHQDHKDILDVISKYNYHFFTRGDGDFTDREHLISGIQVPRAHMWHTLAKTKILVTANLLHLKPREVDGIKLNPRWEENKAFSHIDQGLAPQLKTRPIEAVFNKTLVLLKYDPWNVFAKWFQVGTEFLYYFDKEDLKEKIDYVLANPDFRENMVENAYIKAMVFYTTENFFRELQTSDSIRTP